MDVTGGEPLATLPLARGAHSQKDGGHKGWGDSPRGAAGPRVDKEAPTLNLDVTAGCKDSLWRLAVTKSELEARVSVYAYAVSIKVIMSATGRWNTMPMATTEIISLEDARKRHATLIAGISDLDEFKARGIAYALSDDDQALYDDLMELEYLIGD